MDASLLPLLLGFLTLVCLLTFTVGQLSLRRCARLETRLATDDERWQRRRSGLAFRLASDRHFQRALLTLRTRVLDGQRDLSGPTEEGLATLVCSRWQLIHEMIAEAPHECDSLLDYVTPAVIESHDLLRPFLERQRRFDPSFASGLAVLDFRVRDRAPVTQPEPSVAVTAPDVLRFRHRSA